MKYTRKQYLDELGVTIEKGDLVYKENPSGSIDSWEIEDLELTKNGFLTVWSDVKGYRRFKPYDLFKINVVPNEALKWKASAGNDPVQHPAHYTKWVIQPRDFCMKNNLPFWMGSVLKYIMRAGEKTYEGLTEKESEILDLEKAKEFIESRLREVRENTP